MTTGFTCSYFFSGNCNLCCFCNFPATVIMRRCLYLAITDTTNLPVILFVRFPGILVRKCRKFDGSFCDWLCIASCSDSSYDYFVFSTFFCYISCFCLSIQHFIIFIPLIGICRCIKIMCCLWCQSNCRRRAAGFCRLFNCNCWFIECPNFSDLQITSNLRCRIPCLTGFGITPWFSCISRNCFCLWQFLRCYSFSIIHVKSTFIPGVLKRIKWCKGSERNSVTHCPDQISAILFVSACSCILFCKLSFICICRFFTAITYCNSARCSVCRFQQNRSSRCKCICYHNLRTILFGITD